PPSTERSRHVFWHDALASAYRSRTNLPVDLPHDLRPPIDDGQHRVGLLGREHRHDAGDARRRQALYPVKIIAEAERGHFDRSRIAAGLLYHLAEFREDLGYFAAGGWNPTIPIADHAPRTIREGAADMDRRVWFLHRLRSGDHRIEID